MPVDEPQAAAGRQGGEHPEKKRAIAAEHERPLASLQQIAHPGGDRFRRPAYVACSNDTCLRVTPLIRDACISLAGVATPKPFE